MDTCLVATTYVGDAPPIPSASASSGGRSDLEELRNHIDALDTGLAVLLLERTFLARKAALVKAVNGLPLRSKEREERVRRNYAQHLVGYSWRRSAVQHIMDALIEVSLGIQQDTRIAIQGGHGSWSEESLVSLLPSARVMRCTSVEKAWGAVKSGKAAGAWLAMHNSQTGDIESSRRTRELGQLIVEREYPVPHALMARPETALGDVREVAGHPQALAQCKQTLDTLLPRVRSTGTVDGAYSARRIRHGEPVAVVGSSKLASRLRLRVLHASIVDDPTNTTTFGLFVPKTCPPVAHQGHEGWVTRMLDATRTLHELGRA